MAEQKKDTLHIRLHVYDEEIDVTINREDEEYYRAAASFITDRYNTYAQMFKGRKSDHTIALMAMVDIALRYKKEQAKNDTAPYSDILQQLTAEIEQTLSEK
ncbi:cell division protein ZapA [Xylanibacter muris]|uniref:Cell division protein ZapA n=1 Tax=Xylanibacter muris TaxID=2736290 RepID=A0ABX2AQX6_9BACT|nr:cell division protein ZapA [Xylanibacter muris]NPD92635.1 cell division protein ZapA [Xylanibacter muris]